MRDGDLSALRPIERVERMPAQEADPESNTCGFASARLEERISQYAVFAKA